MALLSALLAWLGNRLGSLFQAVLGWSVTALFGRLPSNKQTALSIALVLSLLWPVMVIGVFIPSISAWAFAFLPLQKWIGQGVVRWASVGLALTVPVAVGMITRWVTPPAGRASPVRAGLAGFPLTVGYAVACIVTAVTVPVVKIGSTLRGWADEHVYVQPRVGEYDDALRELARACEAAEIRARIEPVPSRMMIAANVLKWFAQNFVRPMVAERPQMLRADGLEAYLYPADLLLRGKKKTVARVRATMTRTFLERYAFMVSDPAAQGLQDELQRLWHVVRRHRSPAEIGWPARSRLREIAHDLEHIDVPFDQWVVLDRSLHRLERALVQGPTEILKDDLALKDASNGENREESAMTDETTRSTATLGRDEPTRDLIREAFDETRELVRLEVALAREEIRNEVQQVKVSAIALGGACGLAIASFTMFMVALALAFSTAWLSAIVIAGILLVVAGALGLIGYKRLPTKPMGATVDRLKSDAKQLKERMA